MVRIAFHGLAARVRAPLLALAAALLAGCGDDEKLPEPGASGLVVVHAWDRPGEAPARIEAHQIAQKDSSFKVLILDRVLMRLPKRDGVVYLAAPLATYASEEATAIKLTGRSPGEDGPVRFNGVWRGKLFVGRAASASFDQRTRVMHFDDVEILSEGLLQWTAAADVGDGSAIRYGQTQRRPDVPAMTAALAALPQPLALPER